MTSPVAGYEIWYDASQITGTADGTSLGTWSDLSGNANTLTASPADPVYYKTTGAKLINGLPAVWFTAASTEAMATSGPFQFGTSGSPVTIQAVVNLSTLTTETIVGSGTSGGFEFRIHDSGGALEALATTEGSIAVSSLTLTATTPVVVGVTYDGTTLVFYSAGSSDSHTVSQGINSGVLWVGQNAVAGANYLNGAIGELLVYPSVLSGPNIAANYTYLYNKWISTPAPTTNSNFLSFM